MLALLLLQKIVSLFLIMLSGALLVRLGMLKAGDSKILSVLTVYLIIPCLFISAFQVEYSEAIRDGLLLGLLGALVSLSLMLLITRLLGRALAFDPVEKLSLTYTNAGNLLIPLVVAMLGESWAIYTCSFMAPQMLLLFSHGKSVLCGQRRLDWKGLVKNVNLIAITAGLLLFLFRIRLLAPLADFCSAMGSMTGPMAMLVTGMIIGGMDLRRAVRNKRVWLIVLLRLVVLPLLVLPALKLTPLARLAPEGAKVLLICFLATATPSASMVTQLAQLYGQDADYASVINVLSTLLCALTLPVMVLLYQL